VGNSNRGKQMQMTRPISPGSCSCCVGCFGKSSIEAQRSI
jgi:hypothetical protein